MNKLTPALVALFLAAACGGSGDTSEPRGPDVDAAGVWALESGHAPSGEVPLVEGYGITLRIDGAAADGTASCNTYAGGIEVRGSSFDAGEFAVTEIGCPDEVAESEERYLEAIAAADTIAVDGDTLTLTGPEAELVYRLVPPVKTRSLVDTTWRLDGLVEGRGPDATVSSAAPAQLRLSSDGTHEGSTGCRDFSGKWSKTGDQIVFTSMSFTGSCSKRATPQDEHVIAVLVSGFRIEVEGHTLTVTSSRDPLGLVYVSK